MLSGKISMARGEAGQGDGIVASSLATALVTGLIGFALLQQGWPSHPVLAGVLAFVVLAAVVNLCWSLQLGDRSAENPGGSRFGEANQVTLLRAGLVSLVAGALLAIGQTPQDDWSLVLIVACALVLDGVDGYLARRLRLASRFGARFDMEVDALLLLILALLVWQMDRAGAWVLAIGLIRYAFVAAGLFLPALRAALPGCMRRKVVCVLQGVVLMICLLPPLASPLTDLLAGAALVALIVSFLVDIRFLLAQPRMASQALRA